MQCLVNKHKFTAVLWDRSMAFPLFGSAVGVDTLTTLIDRNNSTPDLAYLGVYNPRDNTAYIVKHTDALLFMQHLSSLKVTQYYFNAAFDFCVLLKKAALEGFPQLFAAADAGYIIDIGVRSQLLCIATLGYVQGYTYTLKGLCKHYMKYNMLKGELKGLLADRLTFSPDKDITLSQTVYLGIDCYCTYKCGEEMIPRATLRLHTLGSIVLYCILRNGLNVDMRIWLYFLRKLELERDAYRQDLIGFGYPDPLKPKLSPSQIVDQRLLRAWFTYMLLFHRLRPLLADSFKGSVTKGQAVRMLVYMLNILLLQIPLVLHSVILQDKPLTKLLRLAVLKLQLKYDVGFYIQHKKPFLVKFILAILLLFMHLNKPSLLAFLYALLQLLEHLDWYTLLPPIGPKKFMQLHLSKLILLYPKLRLPMTKKSRLLKMTKDDLWRLLDLGINDPLLKALLCFGHARKYLTTYLSRLFLRPDGKIHPRFTNILRTGRTSCSVPNVQNLPSRDKVFALKNMYCPPPGAILCATDFSFVLLCAFAQACFTRFGRSTMRDIINAGVDPHRWFAGVMYKVIDAKTDMLLNSLYAKLLNAMLKLNVTDAQRQLAKAANFGLPGGMSGKRFYEHCRSSGIFITLLLACAMRLLWISAFPLMKRHMRPDKLILIASKRARFYRIDGLMEDDLELLDPLAMRRNCSATLITGFVRNKCTYNAALNIQFQGITATGAKLAGWLLLKIGMALRLYNFVHDEYLYWLWPLLIRLCIPMCLEAMLRGMRMILPDVRVGVLSSCMRHWDKKAITFDKLLFDEYNIPLNIELPPLVKLILNKPALRENGE